MPLRRLLPLLSCPLCAVENARTSRPPLLRNPFTLHCGHTVCSSHLNTLDPTQPCPLPVCSSTPNPNTIRPNIPRSSGVVYLPAAPPPPPARRSTPTSTDQRVDITISKLIEVVSRHSGPLSLPPPPPPDQGDSGQSDGDDCQAHPRGRRSPRTALPSSEEEAEFPTTRDPGRSSGRRGRRRRRRAPELASRASISESTLTSANLVSADSAADAHPSPSEHASRSRSPLPPAAGGENSDGGDSSPEPPKKRPRRDSRALVTDREIEPEAETSNSDSPNDPNANTSHPSRSGAEPRQNPAETSGEDPRTRIDKELLTELSCEICFTIYYQPVTTPCQHTFCGRCLQRSLDHRSHCPICRADLPEYGYLLDAPQNKVVLAIELEAFPELYAERGRLIEEEERNARLDTPLFVCQLSFPGVPTNLHFFEPRYRLMLRRCLESPTPRFGMVMPPKPSPTAVSMDFGTMLEIKSVRMLPDGRSLVQTLGVSRFRILEKGTMDGYMVGRVEYIEDFPGELEDTLDAALEEKAAFEAVNQNATTHTALPTPQVNNPLPERRLPNTTNEALMNKCRAFVEQLRVGAAPWIVQKLNESYGNMPTDPSRFSFWIALVLPIDEYEKAKLLPIRSARLRLKLVAYWIDQLNSNW